LVESAVEDAELNSKMNGISNVRYLVGKAEVTIKRALDGIDQSHQVTAVVDPPRVGLHNDVLRMLRNCRRIKRIVYVSCNPRTLLNNVKRLIQPANKRFKGEPFKIDVARPVDMFPHTFHVELVMMLTRP